MSIATKERERDRSKRKIAGQALVEFALVLPLLVVLLFAILQWGLILHAYMTLHHGAYRTARTLSLVGSDVSNVTTNNAIACQAIAPLACSRLVKPVQVTINAVDGASAVNVRLTYNLPVVANPFGHVIEGYSVGNTFMIVADATYRRE
jgi:Flp pilus assembly protein TadG